MILQQYYTEKTTILSEYAENAAFDIKQLICKVLGMSENTFFMNMHLILTDGQISELDEVVNRRLEGEPLQYILGKWSFMGHEFKVGPACLIPRQDTETLVEYAIKEILRHNYESVLDMCTGSGCIAVSVAMGCGARVTASDISGEALALARVNAEMNNTVVEFIESDMFLQIRGSYDVITANPPYLTRDEMQNLQRELTHEPREALYGGDDGLEFYRRIASDYSEHLNDGGVLLLEVGETQADAVRAMFDGKESQIITDLCGKMRVVSVGK